MQHSPILSVIIMIIASIIIGYYLTMTILLRNNKTNNRNKLYQSLLMGFWMGFIELAMIIILMKLMSKVLIILLIFLLIGIIILTWLIYEQIGIGENQFMLSMIEHHQMAIDMTTLVKPRTKNTKLLSIMDEILESQVREINQMKNILDEQHIPRDISTLLHS